jgi:hypothetical protein
MQQVKNHLAMVFHRFIELKKIKIFFQGRLIEDGIHLCQMIVQDKGFPEEPLYGGRVKVKGFVLLTNLK